MKGAINHFIPIVKDPMNDITGRCVTNNGLDYTYRSTYQGAPTKAIINQQAASVQHYLDVQMETNSMEIQYNNLIEFEDYQQQQYQRLHAQSERLPPSANANRKRTYCECDVDSAAKRCRKEESDPSLFLLPEQSEKTGFTPTPIAKCQSQTHQRQPTHNMPDMPRCMMGHYI